MALVNRYCMFASSSSSPSAIIGIARVSVHVVWSAFSNFGTELAMNCCDSSGPWFFALFRFVTLAKSDLLQFLISTHGNDASWTLTKLKA